MWPIKIPGKKINFKSKTIKINMHHQVVAALKNSIKRYKKIYSLKYRKNNKTIEHYYQFRIGKASEIPKVM